MYPLKSPTNNNVNNIVLYSFSKHTLVASSFNMSSLKFDFLPILVYKGKTSYFLVFLKFRTILE